MLPLLSLLLALPSAQGDVPTVVLDADDTVVTQSCTIEVDADWIEDANGDGILHVTGDDIVVDFGGDVLRGAPAGEPPDTRRGIGVVVTGKRVTVRNARFAGLRCAVLARGTEELTIHRIDARDGLRQRLGSTPAAEDPADWLEPHANDENEWLERYGAAIWVEDSTAPSVSHVRVREFQNGIVFDEVTGGRVFDCDCSFLSGWGLALWRSSDNAIVRNAFDFCVRGYSHGVYNRGQDSAGILLFEQCSRNTIAENSATHCGDGIFVFAGREALGQAPPPSDGFRHKRRGCNNNVFYANDLSYSVAHGLELTFSFNNLVHGNEFVGNAICGIWGGYSKRTRIYDNEFSENGDMGYGEEHGAINIEHGARNSIAFNDFAKNSCGVHLWWDEDAALAATPWVAANGAESAGNTVFRNTFHGDNVGVRIRGGSDNRVAHNTFGEVGTKIDVADAKKPGLLVPNMRRPPAPPTYDVPAVTRPTEERQELAGRSSIVMTEWGPYDHTSPLLQLVTTDAEGHEYRLHGAASEFTAEVEGAVSLEVDRRTSPARLSVRPEARGAVVPYTLRVGVEGELFEESGDLFAAPWIVWVFPWQTDPREDLDAWHAEAAADHLTMEVPALTLDYRHGGPSEARLASPTVRGSRLPADRFGTIATCKVRVPAGRWRLSTRSDDGIRLWADRELLVDDWTQHGPRSHSALLEVDEIRSVDLRVEHFELDGFATLEFAMERAD